MPRAGSALLLLGQRQKLEAGEEGGEAAQVAIIVWVRLWAHQEVLVPVAVLLPVSRCSPRRRPRQEVWYFAYGANMDDSTFRVRRGIQALECRSGRIKGYRLRFNLDGRPKGKAAPANLHPDPGAEVWGVL